MVHGFLASLLSWSCSMIELKELSRGISNQETGWPKMQARSQIQQVFGKHFSVTLWTGRSIQLSRISLNDP